jgi:hypothetical protein
MDWPSSLSLNLHDLRVSRRRLRCERLNQITRFNRFDQGSEKDLKMMAWRRNSLGWLKAHIGAVVHSASELVIVVGLPIAIYQMAVAQREAHKHALETHEQVYSVLDAQYTDFLKLCLQYPRLDCFDLPADPAPSLSDDERIQQQILYATIIPMLEHAYLTYHGRPALEIQELTNAQWPGWELYASSFMKRPAFLKVWKKLGIEFDSHFQKCMNALPAREEPEPCDPWSPSAAW